MTPTKTIPPISAESVKVRDFMRLVKEGEIATVEQISKAVGVDMSNREHIVRSGIHQLEKEGIVFYRVRNVGWKRVALASDEVITGESSVPKQISRKVKKSLRRLSAVKFDELSNADKLRHSAVSAQIGTIALFTQPKARDRIYAATIGNGSKPDKEKLLELFKKD